MKKNFIFMLFSFLCFYLFSMEPVNIIYEIRKVLPKLNDSPIGAIDADGKFLDKSNNGLNCSGFAKWIVDGFYTPLCNDDESKYTSI